MSESHKCNVCSCDYTDDEGGMEGYFGILPVTFCPTCFSCMCDMAALFLTPEDLKVACDLLPNFLTPEDLKELE